MADDTSGDKTEAPTPKRREEAREQGNIPKSADLTAAVLLIGAMFLLKWFGGRLFETLQTLMQDMLGSRTFAAADSSPFGPVFMHSIASVAMAMAPLLAGVMLIAVSVNVAQAGLYFNPGRVSLNFAALNPVGGFSRLFKGGQGLVKLGMSLLKLVLVGLMAYSALHGRLGQIMLVQQFDYRQVFGLAAELIFSIAVRIGVLLLVLAIIDYAWQRYHIEQGLKMSKQDVKEEMKNMDGDPRMKARRRQLALARLKEQLKKDVPKADVVVTNPTEFAVALQYDPESMNAPKVVAKGQGYIAARIREIAIENGIPILERKPLARALYKICNVGQEVPEQYFSAIAEILAYVYELNGKFKQKHFAKAG